MEVQYLIADEANYTHGRNGKPVEFLAVHYTANDGSARNNAVYFSREPVQSSAHYFIDDMEVWQSVRDSDTAYSVGNFDMNQRSISIEVVSDGSDFTEAEIVQLTELVQMLMKRHGIPAENVIRHQDAYDHAMRHGYGLGSWIDPYKACPLPYTDHAKWHALWERITGVSGTAPEPVPDNPSPDLPEEHEEEDFGGTYVVNCAVLNVRDAPTTHANIVAQYTEGQTVELDNTYTIANGYVWGTYVAYSGVRRYIAVGKHTGKPETDDYLVKA